MERKYDFKTAYVSSAYDLDLFRALAIFKMFVII